MYYDYMVQIRKQINVIYQIIKLKKENQVIISDTENSIWKYLTFIPDKNVKKIGIEWNSLNPISCIYQKKKKKRTPPPPTTTKNR